MPQMGVTNKDRLKLIQFVGVPLDGSIEYNGSTYTWDDLLNQVTYNEMVELIIDGQHQTARVGSVSKPATRDENGPSGFNSNFLGGGSGTAYPAPCVRAATWNDELVKRVGELIGEDGLASRYNGLLGPAANIHRNAYCGRRRYRILLSRPNPDALPEGRGACRPASSRRGKRFGFLSNPNPENASGRWNRRNRFRR